MRNSMWRGRLMMFCLGCTTLLTAGGCTGLSDQQLSSILQAVVSTGLSALVQAAITAVGGQV